MYRDLESRIRTTYQFLEGELWIIFTIQLWPLQNGVNNLLKVQATAGPYVRIVKGNFKMTSKVISDFLRF